MVLATTAGAGLSVAAIVEGLGCSHAGVSDSVLPPLPRSHAGVESSEAAAAAGLGCAAEGAAAVLVEDAADAAEEAAAAAAASALAPRGRRPPISTEGMGAFAAGGVGDTTAALDVLELEVGAAAEEEEAEEAEEEDCSHDGAEVEADVAVEAEEAEAAFVEEPDPAEDLSQLGVESLEAAAGGRDGDTSFSSLAPLPLSHAGVESCCTAPAPAPAAAAGESLLFLALGA